MKRAMTAVAMVVLLAACTKEQATEELGAVKKANEAAKAASAHANIAGVDPIGIPECDKYLEKYESCLTDKIPADQQQKYRAQLEAQRNDWRASAADPERRSGISDQCKQATRLANTTFASFGCEF